MTKICSVLPVLLLVTLRALPCLGQSCSADYLRRQLEERSDADQTARHALRVDLSDKALIEDRRAGWRGEWKIFCQSGRSKSSDAKASATLRNGFQYS